jgi:hypothetical protein
MMSGLPSKLRRRLLPAYLFLVMYSAAGLAIVGVSAPGWDLRLVDLRLSETDLRPRVPPQLSLLGHWRMCCGCYAWVVPLSKALRAFWWGLLFFSASWVLLGQHAVGANVEKRGFSNRLHAMSLRLAGCPG